MTSWFTSEEWQRVMAEQQDRQRQREQLLRHWLYPSVLAHVDVVGDLPELRSLLEALIDERTGARRLYERDPIREARRDGELNMLHQVLAVLPAETSHPQATINPDPAPEQRSTP